MSAVSYTHLDVYKRQRFEQEHERTPSPEELATELELPKEKVTDTLRVAGRHVSVDAPFADGEDNSLLDLSLIHI